jgi:hypothetical protein
MVNDPSLITWNRLEGQPRQTDLSESLRGEIRDALWMLTRQWQLGEFEGEDAGSIALAKVRMKTSPITHYLNRDRPVSYSQELPLELEVEREPVPLDLMMRLQMGQHWMRLIKPLSPAYRRLYRSKFPIDMPSMEERPDAFSNRAAWQLNAAAAGRGMDGGAFYRALKAGERAEDMSNAGIQIAPGDKKPINTAAKQFMARYDRLYGALYEAQLGSMKPKRADQSAWVPEQLEYQFACAAPEDDGRYTVLRSQEYYQGHLDWYTFEIDQTAEAQSRLPHPSPTNAVRKQTLTFLPAEVRFSGMPNRRWWEMDDCRSNYGAIQPDTTDLVTLLLTEFGLIYGNDWLMFPFVVPVGSLCEVQGLSVTDVFGGRTLILPAGQERDGWRMYNLSTLGEGGSADVRLFVPPATAKLLESQPVESVTFLRDEMANVVWAVESTVPNEMGGGMNGYEAALALVNLLQPPDQVAQPGESENEALIRYVLGGGVPENWIPFIPVHSSDSQPAIRLQRAAMPRTIPLYPETVSPRGQILRPGQLPETPYFTNQNNLPFFINEEEVPRAGAIVSRTYQRARWINGETFVWVGRRKKTGRGEGSSGLRFDRIEPKMPTSNG